MEEITKHINDTNASYRHVGAGDAKNTDLFLDNEHYELFRNSGEQITVRFDKTNLTQAILFIASILPRKFDQSATHEVINYSDGFVLDQLAILDAVFKVDGVAVSKFTQTWNPRKDVPKKNGEIDTRFYFNGLLKDVQYINHNGQVKNTRFTIRNYFAGGFSNLNIKKAADGIFDLYIDNVTEPYNDGKEDGYEEVAPATLQCSENSLQQIYYGAPGTGKSHIIKELTKGKNKVRTTFHPDSDYSTFVGAYKPTTKSEPKYTAYGEKAVIIKDADGNPIYEDKIVYEFVNQAFLKAYIAAWKQWANGDAEPADEYLIIEEINRGNCAQIFGDLFQLLDRNNSGFSDYPIKADNDMKKQLAKAFNGLSIAQADKINSLYDEDDIVKQVLEGDILLLPNNLFIWATMNTSDQSLFPIDSAFKRRWDWKYMPISDAGKGWTVEANGNQYSWWEFLSAINELVGSTTSSEDKKLGYFFCKAKDGIIDADTFVGKVVFYLWNDVFKDYGFEGSVFQMEDGSEMSFGKFYKAGNDSIVEESTIARFMTNLGVEPIEASMDKDESLDDDNQKPFDDNTGKSILYIHFKDDDYSAKDYNHFDSYLDALRHIGIDKVAEVAAEKKYKRHDCPLISTEQYQAVIDDPAYSYVKEGDYYVIKGIDDRTKEAFIRHLAQVLGINLTYYYS